MRVKGQHGLKEQIWPPSFYFYSLSFEVLYFLSGLLEMFSFFLDSLEAVLLLNFFLWVTND